MRYGDNITFVTRNNIKWTLSISMQLISAFVFSYAESMFSHVIKKSALLTVVLIVLRIYEH